MLYEKYQIEFSKYFNSEEIKNNLELSIDLFKKTKQESPNVFFIGNGGSNSICSHMMEDFAKIQKFKTFSFSDPSLITCYSNDYGYENAIEEWIKIYFQKNDILVSISSSGKSPNILNATQYASKLSNRILTFSGFEENNPLSKLGNINFYLPINNYGIVECFHQVLLHTILDSIND
jgi:D-sedoheptulose 7-phosphate isomerase